MSLYKHRRTGVLYRTLFSSFDVCTQEHQWVYISIKTGEIFNRSQIKFAENFELIEANPQGKIIPKDPHE